MTSTLIARTYGKQILMQAPLQHRLLATASATALAVHASGMPLPVAVLRRCEKEVFSVPAWCRVIVTMSSRFLRAVSCVAFVLLHIVAHADRL